MKNIYKKLKKIIEINSYTKNKAGVDLVGAVLAKEFMSLGLKLQTHERAHVGNHLHFISQKKYGTKVLLLGHLDTVFPPDSFEGFSEDEEWVYGPGVCDMKGGVIVALEALREVHKHQGELFDIDVLLVSDEESGSDDSKLLSQKLATHYDVCFDFEAAGPQYEVVVARKGVGTFFIDIEGKAAHAGNCYNEGINANLEASYKLQAITALTNLEEGTTVNVGKIEGGIGANTISPKASLCFELRYEKESEKIRVLEAIEQIVLKQQVKGIKAVLRGGIQREVMQESEKQKKVLLKMQEILKEEVLTERRGGVSDANVFAGMGVVTFDGFGPFGDGDHTVSERALKKSFGYQINRMKEILLQKDKLTFL